MKTLRSELKIRFSFSPVCVHELAAVAAATAATTSLPYRHRHRRYHHHQHHTAHKSTTAGLLTTAGGVSGYATQSVADSTLLLLTRCILQFSIHLALPSTENFSRGLPDAKNTQLVCSEEYTASKLVLFCLYIPKSDYSSVGTTYSTVSFNPHLHPNFVQAATTAPTTTTSTTTSWTYQNSHFTATAVTRSLRLPLTIGIMF